MGLDDRWLTVDQQAPPAGRGHARSHSVDRTGGPGGRQPRSPLRQLRALARPPLPRARPPTPKGGEL
eukprot:459200-Prymnesium_polylepis.2